MAVHEHPIQWDPEKVARLWDYYARTITDAYFSKLYGEWILRRSRIPLRAALDVLDFGCGPGYMWDHLQLLKAGWRYTGVDFSAGSVAALNRRAAGDPHFLGAHPITGLPTTLPANRFDVVLLLEVVEHLDDATLAGTMAEVVRVLKPGGRLVITTPNNEDLTRLHKFCPECGAVFHEWQHVRSWNRVSLKAMAESHGLLLQFAAATHFAAHGLLRKAFHFVRRVRAGNPEEPHLIAVFGKPLAT